VGLQEKFQVRLKVLEEGLKGSNGVTRPSSSDGRSSSNGPSRRQSIGGAEMASRLVSNGLGSRRTSLSQTRSSISSNASTVLKNAKGASRSFDGGRSNDGVRSLERVKSFTNGFSENHSNKKSNGISRSTESHDSGKENSDNKVSEFAEVGADDSVSGVLYDMLQKEVIALRKASHEKDQSLKDKDDAIEVHSLQISRHNVHTASVRNFLSALSLALVNLELYPSNAVLVHLHNYYFLFTLNRTCRC